MSVARARQETNTVLLFSLDWPLPQTNCVLSSTLARSCDSQLHQTRLFHAMWSMVAREELVGVSILVVIGITLIALAPAKTSVFSCFQPTLMARTSPARSSIGMMGNSPLLLTGKLLR
jgi:hypothetical protein